MYPHGSQGKSYGCWSKEIELLTTCWTAVVMTRSNSRQMEGKHVTFDDGRTENRIKRASIWECAPRGRLEEGADAEASWVCEAKTRGSRVGVAESRQRQADSVIGCGIAVPKMSRMRDIDGAPDKTHLIPTKYRDSRSWPRLRADNHSNQRHEYDSLGPRTLISEVHLAYIASSKFVEVAPPISSTTPSLRSPSRLTSKAAPPPSPRHCALRAVARAKPLLRASFCRNHARNRNRALSPLSLSALHCRSRRIAAIRGRPVRLHLRAAIAAISVHAAAASSTARRPQATVFEPPPPLSAIAARASTLAQTGLLLARRAPAARASHHPRATIRGRSSSRVSGPSSAISLRRPTPIALAPPGRDLAGSSAASDGSDHHPRPYPPKAIPPKAILAQGHTLILLCRAGLLRDKLGSSVTSWAPPPLVPSLHTDRNSTVSGHHLCHQPSDDTVVKDLVCWLIRASDRSDNAIASFTAPTSKPRHRRHRVAAALPSRQADAGVVAEITPPPQSQPSPLSAVGVAAGVAAAYRCWPGQPLHRAAAAGHLSCHAAAALPRSAVHKPPSAPPAAAARAPLCTGLLPGSPLHRQLAPSHHQRATIRGWSSVARLLAVIRDLLPVDAPPRLPPLVRDLAGPSATAPAAIVARSLSLSSPVLALSLFLSFFLF
ncbi:hypothetical protein Scep_012211 [Stephania cephalantha]|uniref:Uncharacterized protein n=1 Tax=Stephania cephalantha TaxID=152367 RepID=A0AAP0P6I8_9MAGN